MTKGSFLILLLVLTISFLTISTGCRSNSSEGPQTDKLGYRQILGEEYTDKMKAGWIGQMAGVGWGAPTESRFKGQIIPEDSMPQWQPEMINQYEQDDIYINDFLENT